MLFLVSPLLFLGPNCAFAGDCTLSGPNPTTQTFGASYTCPSSSEVISPPGTITNNGRILNIAMTAPGWTFDNYGEVDHAGSGQPSISVSASATLINEPGGAIMEYFLKTGTSGPVVHIDNAGAITVTTNDASAICFNDYPKTATDGQLYFINRAGAQVNTGSGGGFDVRATYFELDNAGMIDGQTIGVADNSIESKITNSGEITDHSASGTGVDSTARSTTITNEGLIDTGFGVKLRTDTRNTQTSPTLINLATGTISGAYGTTGDGVEVINSTGTTTNATIDNQGTILGARYGIYASTSSDSTLDITNSGAITGNGGVAILFGAGTNSLQLQAGWSITGNVVGQTGGDNTLLLGGDTTDATTTFNMDNIAPAGSSTEQYQGFAAFQKTGDSTWTLTGTTTAATPWTVSAGTLKVNGSTASSPVTVAAAATLTGAGAVGNTSIAGTLAPGDGTPGSSMAVNGALAFDPGARYAVLADASGASQANVNGPANVDNVSVSLAFVGTPPALHAGDRIVLMTATTMTGEPVNKTLSAGGYLFDLKVVGNQLIAILSGPVNAAAPIPALHPAALALLAAALGWMAFAPRRKA